MGEHGDKGSIAGRPVNMRYVAATGISEYEVKLLEIGQNRRRKLEE